MTSMTHQVVRAALAAAASLALLVPASPAVASRCEDVYVRTYKVRVRAAERVYHLGDTAVIKMKVTRKDTGEPVEDAKAAVVTHMGDVYRFSLGKTDSLGEMTARFRLSPKRWRPGYVMIHAMAWRRHVDNPCASVTESGKKKVRRAFRIVR